MWNQGVGCLPKRQPSPAPELLSALPPGIVAGFEAAIAEASAFIGATAPNPPVGCTLLDTQFRPLVSAAHERAGQPHAEANALARAATAGLTDRIAHVVVTLEPCNHTGRTPPCTEAILASPARHVWIGARDPNPRVAGGGIERLRAAGREVHVLDRADGADAAGLAAACAELIAPFVHHARTGRPLVVAKVALDAQGSMIPPPGRRTFTSEDSLRLAHLLRRQSDAILTGIGTIEADAPEFTVRHLADHEDRRRILAIVSRSRDVPPAYRSAATARGFDVRRFTDPAQAIDAIGRSGGLQLLVEAGPRLLAALREADLIDRLLTIRHDPDGEDAITFDHLHGS